MTMSIPSYGEPTIQDALRWFPRQPGAFSFVGWKEHLFEFLVTHCGDLILHETGAAKKGLNRYCFNSAHFFFLWGLGEAPPRIMEAQHLVDDGSCQQELLEGRLPVVITRTRQRGSPPLGDLAVKQTVFAHRTGGKELERGDEPLFAWARFEIEDFIPELLDDVETVGLTVFVGGDALRTSMTKGLNVRWEAPLPPYQRRLSWSAPFLTEWPTKRVRLAAAGAPPARWQGDLEKRPRMGIEHFKQIHSDFLTFLLPLRRGASLDLVIPILPVSPEEMQAELEAGRETALRETLDFWAEQEARGTQVRIPEPLAENSFRNFPIQVLMAAEKRPGDGLRTFNVGARNYEGIWTTPGAMLTAWGLDFLGRHEEAAAYLELYRQREKMPPPPGQGYASHPGFLTAPKPFDNITWISDHGAVMWSVALHALLTEDPVFIERWLPLLLDGADWLRVQRRQTSHSGYPGILPAGRATDDPTPGQWTWNDAWCHKGLREVVTLLERLGHPEAARWRSEAEDYKACFLAAFREACGKKTFTDRHGKRWPFVPAELLAVRTAQARHPFYLDTGPLFLGCSGLVDPQDPLMDAILAWFTAGPATPHYQPDSDHTVTPVLFHELSSCEPCYSWNTILRLERGERRELVEGLMSLLAGGQEPSILSGVETRHGMFAVLFPTPLSFYLARRALVDDEWVPDEIHLLRMVPTSWLQEGKELSLRHLPTRHGPLSLCAVKRGPALDLRLELPSRRPAGKVVLHRPPGCTEVRVNGRAAAFKSGDRTELAKGC